MTRTWLYDAESAHACPTCSAMRGKPCTNVQGRTIRPPHRTRIVLLDTPPVKESSL